MTVHKRLLDEGIRHKLVIVGEGYDRENIEKEIHNTHTEDSVILPGYCSNPYPYIAGSRVFVCSSFTEGLPVVCMEALCLGVPIVSSYPSVEELFGEEKCGIVTDNSEDGLFDGCRRLLSDENEYRLVKEAAKRRAVDFSGKKMVADVEKMFVSLSEEKK